MHSAQVSRTERLSATATSLLSPKLTGSLSRCGLVLATKMPCAESRNGVEIRVQTILLRLFYMWRYEDECLRAEGKREADIRLTIGRSLRFYGLKQGQAEDAGSFAARLEDVILQAVQLGRVRREDVDPLLKVTKHFELHIDASEAGLRAILCQLVDGTEKIIAHASRALHKSEARSQTHKLDFLCLKWSICNKFKDYLWEAPKFLVRSDNNPLIYVLTTAKLDATGHRWLSALVAFDFEIEYTPKRFESRC
ncbi:hypothetical protein EGW08_017924 [Elysia chlorotica]|uniref:Reverse transcriptase RNase H-like domain-containing protein n=1 Tax=Elysia chlorotica TaxID=188477 RepID=A0A3S1BT89_ELYCH|nr:hypothetical protein EGW08_017924 [Elysia chlorotica]